METTKVKLIELIIDWNLWPRADIQKLDSTNLSKMKVAIRAGIKLPPLVVNRKDNRVIDGFHRLRAYQSIFGDDYEVDVIYLDFKKDSDVFIESARLNNNHGLPLSPKDRAYVISKARKMKVPMPAICEALGMDVDYAKEFLAERTAKTRDGETVILSGGARNLAGKTLTKEQEAYTKVAPGSSAQMYLRLAFNALSADAVIYTDKVIESMRVLHLKLSEILEEIDHDG